jgi:hypothetical protein
VAVIGVASVEHIKANVGIVMENLPMTLAERTELEQAMA